MIERIDEMPAGTVGLDASGKLSRDDYQNVLEPALEEGLRRVSCASCSSSPTSRGWSMAPGSRTQRRASTPGSVITPLGNASPW